MKATWTKRRPTQRTHIASHALAPGSSRDCCVRRRWRSFSFSSSSSKSSTLPLETWAPSVGRSGECRGMVSNASELCGARWRMR